MISRASEVSVASECSAKVPTSGPHAFLVPAPTSTRQDIATFATTGGVVWQAAHRLVDYLEATADETGLSRPGVNVLELGSGTGWTGMVLAQNLPNVSSGDKTISRKH